MPERTILIANPAVEQCHRQTAFLQRHGFQVRVARDGIDGIQAVYRHIPDLVIANILLPEINGYQFCRLLKNDPLTQKIPFLLLSHREDKLDKFWGFKAGADAFVYDDEAEDKLLEQISMLLEIYHRISAEDRQRILNAEGKSAISLRTRLNQILDKSLIESTLMVEFRNLCDLTHDRNLLNYMLFSLLESIVEYDAAAIFYPDNNLKPHTVTFNLTDGTSISAQGLEALKEDFFTRVYQECPALQQEKTECDVIGELTETPEAPAFATQTLRVFQVDGEILGAFALYSRRNVAFENIFPVSLVYEEIKLLMKLRHLYSRAEVLAITDGLTGLFNYRQFMIALEREFKRSKRYEITATLALIDVDHFKQFNDRWGHLIGDEVLKNIANQARQCFRSMDFLARYGGEELVVILPETDIEQAQIALERFRSTVENSPVPWQDQQLLSTVSIGLAQLDADMTRGSDWIRKADEALYAAKHKGRNRIEVFTPAAAASKPAGL